jgi:uncharacterized protein YecT (DUF1311 family)
MTRSRWTFLGAAFAAWSVAAQAAAQAPAPDDPCAGATTTIELNACAQQVLARRDRELNEAYRALLRELADAGQGDADAAARADARRLLVEAQRHWLRFRDSDCRGRVRLHDTGSMRGLVQLGCLIAHTEQRTAQLRGWTEP